MKNIKVGIIGIGNIGTAHANCIGGGLVEGMELAALCDISPARQQYCRENYPDIPLFEEYHQMLDSGLIDCVIIAVPHKFHCDIAIEALERNLHTLVEKPIDVTVTKAKRVNELAKKTNKLFAIMFNQRTNEIFQKAREIVKSGALGELKRTVWIVTNWYRSQFYYDSGDWRATWAGEGGGVLLNQAPHNLDIWQWICGVPCEVTAFCDVGKYHDIEVEDDVTIVTRYENGATGAFITSTGEYPGTNRLEISGELGKIVLENNVLKWWKLPINEREFCNTSQNSFPTIETEYTEFTSNSDNVSAHRKILQNMANAILKGEPLISPAVEGINELSISNAAYLSFWKGNIPVKLPLDSEEFDKYFHEKVKNSNMKEAIYKESGNEQYSQRWQVKW